MSLRSILKKSTKVILQLLTILKLSYVLEISIPTSWFIVYSVNVASFWIAKVWKKKISPLVNKRSSSEKLPASVNPKKYLKVLKDISRQMEKDRIGIQTFFSEGHSIVQKRILKELECMECIVYGTVYSSLQQKFYAKDQQMKELWKILETMESDFFVLKCQLQGVTLPFVELISTDSQESSTLNVVPVTTQTVGTDEINHKMPEEVPSSELGSIILTAAKECFEKLVSENQTKGEEMFQNIIKFQEQSRKDIQKVITLFSSAANGSKLADYRDLAFAVEVENIEKNLLETIILLNRQCSGMENVMKILTCFTKKFLCVATKFDAYWQQNKTSYRNTAEKLKETEILWTSSIEKIDSSMYYLLEQSKDLSGIISNMRNFPKLNYCNADFPIIFEKLEGEKHDISDSTGTRIDIMNQKLQDLLVISDNSTERLNTLTQASKKLEKFYNLIRRVDELCGTWLSFCLPCISESGKFNYQSRLSKSSQNSCIHTSDNSNNMMKIIANEDNHATNDALCNGDHSHVNSEFQDLKTDDVISILKDIFEATWGLIDSERMKSTDNEEAGDSMNNGTYNELYEKDRWDNIPFPSESLLDDVSDCLIQDSDESDEVSEEKLDG